MSFHVFAHSHSESARVLIQTSCVQQCGGAEMGMRWPSTSATCLLADHPHFRLWGPFSLLNSSSLNRNWIFWHNLLFAWFYFPVISKSISKHCQPKYWHWFRSRVLFSFSYFGNCKVEEREPRPLATHTITNMPILRSVLCHTKIELLIYAWEKSHVRLKWKCVVNFFSDFAYSYQVKMSLKVKMKHIFSSLSEEGNMNIAG